jgi:fructosamine-3-kinase
VRLGHPLLGATVRAQIEHSASAHLGRPWASQGFISLDDRASHPCGILRGVPFSVFAKLGLTAEAPEQFTAELAGLRLIGRSADVRIPVPVAGGLARTEDGALLLYEALVERPPEAREPADWRSIGYTLAALPQVGHEQFGIDGPRLACLPRNSVAVTPWPVFIFRAEGHVRGRPGRDPACRWPLWPLWPHGAHGQGAGR